MKRVSGQEFMEVLLKEFGCVKLAVDFTVLKDKRRNSD
jgi:hypothetical protein